MGNKPCKLSGTFFNCISIDRNYNNQQSILPHMHDNRLELFYVCSGQGQYMVDNRYYPIGEGDIVICNQGVLHGEEPDQVRQIRSYSGYIDYKKELPTVLDEVKMVWQSLRQYLQKLG